VVGKTYPLASIDEAFQAADAGHVTRAALVPLREGSARLTGSARS
jgi:hypothetical protein